MVLLSAVYGAFYFATLEEHYVGTLRLPVGNGVSDGSVLIIILMIATGIFGNDFWAIQAADATGLNLGFEFLTVG